MTDHVKKVFTFSLMLFSLTTQASPLKEALNARENHQYQRSNTYLAQVKGDKSLTEYLLGYNYNRLNKPALALEHLNRAKSLGYSEANLYIERGLANFKLKRYRAAISDFKHYDRLNPNQAKTDELLGRSYALLGESKKAEVYFTKAEADSRFKPQLMRFKRGLALTRLIQPQNNEDKPWSFSASLGAGYNDNVVALGNNFALPTGISRQGSQFAEVLLSGHNILKEEENANLRVLYQFLGDFYEDVSSLNLLNPFVALEYRKQLNNKALFSLNLASDNSWIGDNRFSSFLSAKPALSYRVDQWNTLEADYGYSYDNFFTATTAVLNRDGFSHLVSINDYITVPNSNLTFRVGYLSSWNNTKGSDFAFHGDNVFVGFRNTLPYKLALEGVYTYGLYRYDNLNSLAGAGGFNYKRRDNINRYSFQLRRDINKTTTVYCRYEDLDDNANIPLYSYKQYIFSMGLTANWS